MSHTNRIDASYPEAALADTLAAISAVEALVPQVVNLDARERKKLAKMGSRSESFVRDALAAAENNPQFLPPYVEPGKMRRDLEYADALGEVEGQLRSLLEKISDTRMLAGAEAYSAARMIYRSLGGAERSGVPGAGALRAALKDRFSGQRTGGSGKREPAGGEGG